MTLQEIINLSKKYTSYIQEEASLFEDVNTVDKKHIANLKNDFLSSVRKGKPVQLLRFIILSLLEQGKQITPQLVDEIKNNLEKRNLDQYGFLDKETKENFLIYPEKRKSFFSNWQNHGKVLFPLLYTDDTAMGVKEYLNNTCQKVIDTLKLNRVATHIVDFNGPQNYGAGGCWASIYPDDKDSHKVAHQLHFNISPEGLQGALFSGTEMETDEIVNERELVTNEANLIEYFRSKVDRWNELNDSLDETPIIPPAKTGTEVITNRFSLNQILYGPPGTGKTYNSIDKAVHIATGVLSDHKNNKIEFDRLRKQGQIEFVTFHQNYTYEDFMVGIKPDTDNATLRFLPYKGIFYQICKRSRDNYEASKLNLKLQSFDTLIEEMLSKITDDQPLEFNTLRGKPFWLTDFTDKTIYLKKSTGSEIHTLSITTLAEIAEGKREMTSGLAVYYYPVIEYLKKNRQSAGTSEDLKRYVLIIDEINRANISKVFGELITLLEDDKRLDGENELRITLPNKEIDFAIPPNLYVIGTMNTADKSIALIDIALRRRFEFEGKYPDYSLIDNPEAQELLRKINTAVFEKKSSADYLIGHAYFMNNKPISETLRNKVIPLLMEYFMSKTGFVEDIFKTTDWKVSYNKETYSWDISKS